MVNRRAKLSAICFVAVLVLLCFALNLSFGPVQIPLPRIWAVLKGSEKGGAMAQIVWQLRLPRALAAMFVGMGLAAAGTILQAVMQNPLAAPSLIGVNSGAGLAAMIIFAYQPQRLYLLVPTAFLGAMLALTLILVIAFSSRGGRMGLILAGIAISALLGAGVDTLRLLHPEALLGATSFMIGGFVATAWSSLRFALPWLGAALTLSLLIGPVLNVLSLGDDVARSLGVPIGSVRHALLALAAILAGSSVAIAGLLSFVGLIVPHAARLIWVDDQLWLLPGAILLGGSFVLACDLIARLLFAPYELPVGILLSFIGGPFFIYVLVKNKE